jgi:hypothetical protein
VVGDDLLLRKEPSEQGECGCVKVHHRLKEAPCGSSPLSGDAALSSAAQNRRRGSTAAATVFATAETTTDGHVRFALKLVVGRDSDPVTSEPRRQKIGRHGKRGI